MVMSSRSALLFSRGWFSKSAAASVAMSIRKGFSLMEWGPLPSGSPLVQWEVSWPGRVCYGRGSAELQGWWMVAGGHRVIAGDALNLVVFLSSSTPTHGHTLVTYTLIDNRTTSTRVDRTGTAIELFNHTTESGGSTKEPTNFLIYTACCCSASNLTFHAFIPPYSPSRCMRITKYSKKL